MATGQVKSLRFQYITDCQIKILCDAPQETEDPVLGIYSCGISCEVKKIVNTNAEIILCYIFSQVLLKSFPKQLCR